MIARLRRAYLLARYILRHEDEIITELLWLDGPDGFPATESPKLPALRGLFGLIVETRP